MAPAADRMGVRMVASCGHTVAGIDDLHPVILRDTARCGCPCVVYADYCAECAADAPRRVTTFADEDAADAWLASLPPCRCWE